jgi:hypothetical protein
VIHDTLTLYADRVLGRPALLLFYPLGFPGQLFANDNDRFGTLTQESKACAALKDEMTIRYQCFLPSVADGGWWFISAQLL